MNDSLSVELFNQAFALGMESGLSVAVFVCVGCVIVIALKNLG